LNTTICVVFSLSLPQSNTITLLIYAIKIRLSFAVTVNAYHNPLPGLGTAMYSTQHNIGGIFFVTKEDRKWDLTNVVFFIFPFCFEGL